MRVRADEVVPMAHFGATDEVLVVYEVVGVWAGDGQDGALLDYGVVWRSLS